MQGVFRTGANAPTNEGEGYPLDENKCRGFSPLLTFLSVLSGSGRPFAESAKILSRALGFPTSATAVQSNSGSAGEQLDDDPYRVIAATKRHQGCHVLLLEMDSTTSPQIQQEEGIGGRESLKQPTEWKMCHVGSIRKLVGGKICEDCMRSFERRRQREYPHPHVPS